MTDLKAAAATLKSAGSVRNGMSKADVAEMAGFRETAHGPVGEKTRQLANDTRENSRPVTVLAVKGVHVRDLLGLFNWNCMKIEKAQ